MLEGTARLAKENCLIAQFRLKNLKPMKAGKLKVNVKFDIDTNGCLKVKVEDPQAGAVVE